MAINHLWGWLALGFGCLVWGAIAVSLGLHIDLRSTAQRCSLAAFLFYPTTIIASFCLLWSLSRARVFFTVMKEMWLPLAAIGVACFFLFLTDQGQDLGVGLIDASSDRYCLKLSLLFFALFFWALSAWHAARLPLARRYTYAFENKDHLIDAEGNPTEAAKSSASGEEVRKALESRNAEPWLRWPPRLAGLAAHFFAALTIALAAFHLPFSKEWDWSKLASTQYPVFAVPAAVISLTAACYFIDFFFILRPLGHYCKKKWSITQTCVLLICLLTGVFTGFAGSELVTYNNHAKQPVDLIGLFSASVVILGSSLLFITITLQSSRLRLRDAHERRLEAHKHISAIYEKRGAASFNVAYEKYQLGKVFEGKIAENWHWTLGLAGLAIIIYLIMSLMPSIWIGRFIGSMVTAFTIFFIAVAIGNLFREVVLKFLLDRPDGILGFFFETPVLLLIFLLLVGVAGSINRDSHAVTLCNDKEAVGECEAAAPVIGVAKDQWQGLRDWKKRPTVSKAVDRWYAQARKSWAKAGGQESEPVPLVIVSTAGGGIRAAYWTATVLQKLQEKVGGVGNLRPYLFAISGVSGGSLGAAAYVASLHERVEASDKAKDATEFLSDDFLAPVLERFVLQDPLTSFIPVPIVDRGVQLEKAWDAASNGRLARSFLSYFPDLAAGSDDNSGDVTWSPILLLNGTHLETGRRIITSHLQIENRIFLDSFDMFRLVQSDMKLSAAAHNSARFSYISPAGKIVPNPPKGKDGKQWAYKDDEKWPPYLGFVIDGGYFENFGALTALELGREIERVSKSGQKNIRLIYLQISSDPGLDERTMARIKSPSKKSCSIPKVGEQQPHSNDFSQFLTFRPPSKNFFTSPPHDGGDFETSFLTQIFGPLAGVLSARIAHGTAASWELAYKTCVVQLDGGENSQSPVFVHLSMLNDRDCQNIGEENSPSDSKRENKNVRLAAPLGWVMSKATNLSIKRWVNQCGNAKELTKVTDAIRVRVNLELGSTEARSSTSP
ncbi:patatin-like phospholipase family protein [Beijerinckia mobilis]|uniref:patatin-like phospholipase family protein n=1 Tax=Beijerinckia mobilis TaxID=231434 RepID=UPI00055142BE|nr:patatin-like phospholipase family protein [Beijerinckia mobilis]